MNRHLNTVLAAAAALLASAVLAPRAAEAAFPAGMPKTVILNRMSVYVPYTPGEQYPSINYNDVRAWLEMTGNTPNAVMGLDSFGPSQWTNSGPNGYAPAANFLGAPNFRYALIAEMGTPTFTAADLIAAMTAAYSDPYYWKVNGKPVLMTYSGGQLGDAWWQNNVQAPLAASGHPIYFFCNCNNTAQPAPGVALPANFPHADGYIDWQYANGVPFRTTDPLFGANSQYSNLDASEATANAAHGASKSYVQGILPYYWAACHPARQYYEYWGGVGMYNQWAVAQSKADAAYLITSNDNAEGTYVVPSRYVPDVPSSPEVIPNFPHLGYYEANKWFIKRFLTGVAPVAKKDAVFYYHRTQTKAATAAAPTGACGAIAANQLYGDLEDYVEVTSWLPTAGAIAVCYNGNCGTPRAVAAGLQVGRYASFTAGATVKICLYRNSVQLACQDSQSIDATVTTKNYGNTSGFFVHDPAKAVGTKDASSDSWVPTDGWATGLVAAGGWF